MKRRIVQPQWPRMCTAVHVFLVLIIVGMALIFSLPGATFTNASFRIFERVGAESQWAFWLFMIALATATGLVTSNKVWVMLSLMCLSTTHGVIALCFYLAISEGVQPYTPGMTTYALIAVLGYYLSWFRWRTML